MKNVHLKLLFERSASGVDLLTQIDSELSYEPSGVKYIAVEGRKLSLEAIVEYANPRSLSLISSKVHEATGQKLKISASDVRAFNLAIEKPLNTGKFSAAIEAE